MSDISCVAFPLALYIIDVKLVVPRGARPVLQQRRPDTLIEVMKDFQWRYPGIDIVSRSTSCIALLAQRNSPPYSSSVFSNVKPPVIFDWTDLLASQPSSYLRLALTLDVALREGRAPRAPDVPISLRDLVRIADTLFPATSEIIHRGSLPEGAVQYDSLMGIEA